MATVKINEGDDSKSTLIISEAAYQELKALDAWEDYVAEVNAGILTAINFGEFDISHGSTKGTVYGSFEFVNSIKGSEYWREFCYKLSGTIW